MLLHQTDFQSLPLSPGFCIRKKGLREMEDEMLLQGAFARILNSRSRDRTMNHNQLYNRKILMKTPSHSISVYPSSSPNSLGQTQVKPNMINLNLQMGQHLIHETTYNRPYFQQRRLQRKKNGLAIFTNTSNSANQSSLTSRRAVTPNVIVRMQTLRKSSHQQQNVSLPWEGQLIDVGPGDTKIKVRNLLQPNINDENLRIMRNTVYQKPAQSAPTRSGNSSSEIFKINRNYKNQIVSYDKHEKQLTNKGQIRRKKAFQLNDLYNDEIFSLQ